MANYTANRVKSAQLAANVVDTVTLGQGFAQVEIVNRDASLDIWITVDRGPAGAQTSTTPTIAGDECMYVGPGGVRIVSDDAGTLAPATVIRLISGGAAAYTVTGHNSL